MKKVLSVVGARPEFIQATRVSQFLRSACDEILVHSGQHYDQNMSGVFFSDLELRTPKYNLEVGSGVRVWRVAEISKRLGKIVESESPDCIVVRGDTDTTLGGALAGACANVPVYHIEAGARSFDRAMPEELNRVLTDHIAEKNFCITDGHSANLDREGLSDTSFMFGDPMYDMVLANAGRARDGSTVLADLGVENSPFYLITVHRDSAVKNAELLGDLIEIINGVSVDVVFPIHPNTRVQVSNANLKFGSNVKLIEPVGYLDMLALEQQAEMILTDSGGVFREAYFLRKRSLCLRTSTELPEVFETGWSKLVGFDGDAITAGLSDFDEPLEHPDLFGAGRASERIAAAIAE